MPRHQAERPAHPQPAAHGGAVAGEHLAVCDAGAGRQQVAASPGVPVSGPSLKSGEGLGQCNVVSSVVLVQLRSAFVAQRFQHHIYSSYLIFELMGPL